MLLYITDVKLYGYAMYVLYFSIAVPPSVAEVKRVPSNGPSPRITLYCTSSAIPPPELLWTIEGRMVRFHDNVPTVLNCGRSYLGRHLARYISSEHSLMWYGLSVRENQHNLRHEMNFKV